MRKTIRDLVKAAIDGQPGFSKVEIGRRHSVDSKDLPAALIYTDSEESEVIAFSNRRFEHDVELKVVIKVRPDGATAGEDDLDELIKFIDPLIIDVLSGQPDITDAIPKSIDFDGDGSADADYLEAERTYTVTYQTQDPS